jgi:hypothetical protein
MSAPQWLIDTFAEAASKLGWRYDGLDSSGMAVIVDDQGNESQYGLQNIERRLLALPPEDRVERLIQHFRHLSTARPTSDLAAARERLLVRLRPAFEPGDPIGEQVWNLPLGETGLAQVLVVDYPDAMNYVTHDMLADSGRSGEDWLAFALDNLRAISNTHCMVSLDEAPGVLVSGVGDAYDAARALILEDLFDTPAPKGFLVGIPSRDRLLVYPIDENPLDDRFPTLLIATLEMHQNEPYPISDGLFWVQENQWEPIGYDYEDGQLSVSLPQTLVDLLNGENE